MGSGIVDDKIRREIILDNYESPFHKGLVDDNGYKRVSYKSQTCIDNLDYQIKIEDNIVKDIRFDGDACAIATSSSSIMINNLIGKSVDDVRRILYNYKNMIEEKDYDNKIIGELEVYSNISKQPNRINCALICCNAIEDVIKN